MWAIVVCAGNGSSPASLEALESLCRAYWYPLYAFVRRAGRKPPDAQDAIQGFFARLLATNGFAKAHREQGRFRTFLLTSLEHYLADEWDKINAVKRGKGKTIVSIEAEQAEGRYLAEPLDYQDPASLYEWRWAMDLLSEVHKALKDRYVTCGKTKRYEALAGFLLPGEGDLNYAEVGRRLSISTSAIAQEVLAMRRCFGELLWTRIRETVATADEAEEEIAHLINVVARVGVPRSG